MIGDTSLFRRGGHQSESGAAPPPRSHLPSHRTCTNEPQVRRLGTLLVGRDLICAGLRCLRAASASLPVSLPVACLVGARPRCQHDPVDTIHDTDWGGLLGTVSAGNYLQDLTRDRALGGGNWNDRINRVKVC